MDTTTFRTQMPVTQRWAFLDHAAVAPLPAPTRDTLAAWADDMAAHGVLAVGRWQARVEATRQRFADLLRAQPDEIAFVKNTSEGIGFVAEGVDWQAGDNVVTSSDEYPANVYPWMNLASRGVELRRVPSRAGRVDLDDLRAAMDARTRVVTLSFVEFATGFRNDLDAVGQLCRERGALFCVDAIQGLGAFDLDVSRLPIDCLAADGHKWLLGPEGAGIFWIRREWIDRLRPVGVGWNSVVGAWEFSTIDFRLKPHAGRWESGTLNVGGIVAMGASLELLLQVGIARVTDRLRELTERLCHQVEGTAWRVFSSRREGEWSGIVSLEGPPGCDLAGVVRTLRERGLVVNQRGGRLRVSPHVYNTPEEIDLLVCHLGEMR
ncbi:MAG: aminotransferase class V-fold PLP-dependent enzyme [Gemmataceae bacterium]